VSNLRKLLSTTAILACACAGTALDTAVAASSAVRSSVPAARAQAHFAAKRKRHFSHTACRSSRHRRKGHSACRSHRAHPGRSHATRNRSAHRARASRPLPAASGAKTVTVSLSPEGSPALASVLATPCQNTDLTPAPGNLAEISAATLCLVNQERARNGELPLHLSNQLDQAAQGHSDEMASENYFAHVAPNGQTPVGRVQDTGYIPSPQAGYTLGENIAWGTLQLSTPSAIVASWIASPEHLANILYSPYRDTAIGVAPAAPASLAQGLTGAVYTQEFGVIVR
jgi:uncharacterized protein YkwD